MVASFRVDEVPRGGTATAMVLLCLFAMLGLSRINARARDAIRRGAIFSVVALVVYLSFGYGPAIEGWQQTAEQAYFGLVAVVVVIAVRYSPVRRQAEFRTSGMDYLIWLAVVVIAVAAGPVFQQPARFIVALLILLYAVEVMITERRDTRQLLVPAALGALESFDQGFPCRRALTPVSRRVGTAAARPA